MVREKGNLRAKAESIRNFGLYGLVEVGFVWPVGVGLIIRDGISSVRKTRAGGVSQRPDNLADAKDNSNLQMEALEGQLLLEPQPAVNNLTGQDTENVPA